MTASPASITFVIEVKNAFGTVSTFTKIQSLSFAQDGAAGGPGATGTRGSRTLYLAIAGSSWSDADANAHITSLSLDPKVVGDTITEYNTGASFSQTRTWNGSAWVLVTQVIDGNLIVTGSVRAEKFSSGGQINLIHNAAFYHQTPSEAFSYIGGDMPQGGGFVYANPSTDWSVNNEVRGTLGHNHGVSSHGGTYGVWRFQYRTAAGALDHRIPVNGGKRFELSAYLATHRASAYLDLQFFNAAGTQLAYLTSTSVTEGEAYGGASLSSYKRVSLFTTAPAGSVNAEIRLVRLATIAPNSDSWVWITRPMFAETTAGATELSSWTPGGLTLIQGGNIATSTISAEKISVSSLSAISANLGAITAGSLNIGSGKFVVDASGNVTIRSSTDVNATRLVITDSKIEVLQGSTLRVRLGIWT
jgi:hypothetical protein